MSKTVKFLKPNGHFNADELAGFPEAVADSLVKAEVQLRISKRQSQQEKSTAQFLQGVI